MFVLLLVLTETKIGNSLFLIGTCEVILMNLVGNGAYSGFCIGGSGPARDGIGMLHIACIRSCAQDDTHHGIRVPVPTLR